MTDINHPKATVRTSVKRKAPCKCNLTDIMRLLTSRADHLSQEEKEQKRQKAEAKAVEAAKENKKASVGVDLGTTHSGKFLRPK